MNLKNKRILITGGTGSFGSTMLKRLLKEKVGELIVFSRDEKKQDDMRQSLSTMTSSLLLAILITQRVVITL